MTTKAQLRKEIDDIRRSLDPAWSASSSLRIINQLERLDTFKAAQRVVLYKAVAGEVDLESLFATCWNSGKHTCVPVFNRALKTYELAETTTETRWFRGNYGILEPSEPSRVPTDAVDFIIVPGVAFDGSGNRLGRGGGYYDRLLDGFAGIKLAVAFDFQLCTHIPHESFDIPVNGIVTESKVIDVCNER